ncbi:hypothetical protein [Butyrivibrio sp. YAB3001]|uniref:hypothetical protein n=1 Tax=Butyrivibrio sp. YAB3001 TaxID=1520812 RepID=UPI0008F685CE|nr:hypothetical protein [Butyrivibrio sp. YAB3001]SFB86816.1 hypothetical protein SAMN02910398_00932 [Butyrivibrio sp. YAB3001]
MSYYEDLKTLVDNARNECKRKAEEYNKLKAARESKQYNIEYLRQNILPKMDSLSKEIESIKENVRKESKRLSELKKKEVKANEVIKPEELTEDAKLLQNGLILKENDIAGILERNSNNRTMTQLAIRYANEHNLKIDKMYLPDDTSIYDSANGAISKIADWLADEDKYYTPMYNVVFGDNSALKED